MTDNKNIYKNTPAIAPESDPQRVDLSMVQARNRFIRAISFFVLILVGGLSLASYIILSSDKDRVEPPPADKQLPQPDLVADSSARQAEVEEISQAIKQAEQSPEITSISALEIARAMGEVRIARQLLSERDFIAAEQHSRAALTIYPDMNEALSILGLAYMHSGRFDQALLVLQKVLNQSPADAEAMNNLATVYIHLRKMDKAEEHLKDALLLQPNYPAAKLNLGLLYLVTGNYIDAITFFNSALPSVANDMNVHNNLGVALLRIGKYNEAREHFQLCIKQAPGTPPFYVNMAITFAMEGDVTNSLQWIRECSRYCPPLQMQRVMQDPDFDTIRETEAFQSLMNMISSPYPANE
ncbi:MAG: tetratricopeptide repeat protein [Spartobacteria bacterium]|nr:tetratricopeptide repeat protein [Spartobacteria bacterium]